MLKTISIWQPWASLLVHNHKFIETRGWPAPKSLIGTTIGIASTKTIKPEQRQAVLDDEFARFYTATGLPPLEELPHGYLLGTVLLHSCEVITDETMEEITEEEAAFGWFSPGRYAWRVRHPTRYVPPIAVRGSQGIWEHRSNGPLSLVPQAGGEAPARTPGVGSHIRSPFRPKILPRP